MDREPTKWIKKEETDEVQTELHLIAQDYPCSMNVKEELEEGVNKEFLEDPLKAGDPSVCVKQDPELKHRAAGSEHNSVEDPLGISLSTDFIKEDPELNITENTAQDYPCSMNVKEELEEGVNKEFLEDPLKAGDPSVCVKQDPELKHRAAGSEHNSVEDPLGISLSTDFIKEDPELNITENTAQVYPCSMNVKEELEEGANKEFLEDPLRADDHSVWVKQYPELKQHAAGSEHNSVEDPLGIFWSTDFIKEDPELNLEMNITENTILDAVHHAGIRLATAAYRTSPAPSLCAEAGEPPLTIRRQLLLVRQACGNLSKIRI
ncbi:uncharacterized protein LOC126108982 isoform X4 [Schistocerca cancellata]|uniref:uncharacterized protein LOC126108982 isoform X4 n=1 Tax=Schistocerca cancellata TaxID=274614 RepID=UPI002118D9B3|nr:uncharacterized protein LOC126108982 isoform X4 [Schistocerca cancellata]